jgi:DNA repair photolyase
MPRVDAEPNPAANFQRPDRLGAAGIAYASVGVVLTPASGFIRAYKFTLNPYNGCGFACDYCYARFFAPSPALRDSWGEWVRVKQNAAETIRAAADARDPRRRLNPGDTIFMSSVTDPYQPIEARLALTRAIVEALIPYQPRLTVQTRSPIVRRDIGLLEQFEAIRVNFSVPTDSEAVRLRYEPHAPSIKERLTAARALKEAGIPIGISISPMLPMEDPAAFGQRIAELQAAEYLATGFHRPGPQFAARTRVETLARLREDGWTRARFEDAREQIRAALGPGRQLLDGRQGFAPPQRIHPEQLEPVHLRA